MSPTGAVGCTIGAVTGTVGAGAGALRSPSAGAAAGGAGTPAHAVGAGAAAARTLAGAGASAGAGTPAVVWLWQGCEVSSTFFLVPKSWRKLRRQKSGGRKIAANSLRVVAQIDRRKALKSEGQWQNE